MSIVINQTVSFAYDRTKPTNRCIILSFCHNADKTYKMAKCYECGIYGRQNYLYFGWACDITICYYCDDHCRGNIEWYKRIVKYRYKISNNIELRAKFMVLGVIENAFDICWGKVVISHYVLISTLPRELVQIIVYYWWQRVIVRYLLN